MTIAQADILRYLQIHFSGCRYELVGNDEVNVIDQTGGIRRFTCNIYSDIMDADTRKIVAVSDVPHNLDKVYTQRPREWTSATSNF